jgi:hypothetical protein
LKNNKEFISCLAESYFWKVTSVEEYDEQACKIELDRCRFVDDHAPFDENEMPVVEVVGRYRLYRICNGSTVLPTQEETTEPFVLRCLSEEEELGYPVLVTWDTDKDSDIVSDWWRPIRYEGQAVFILDEMFWALALLTPLAVACNRKHPEAYRRMCEAYSPWGEQVRYSLYVSGNYEELMQKQVGTLVPGLYQIQGQAFGLMVMDLHSRYGIEVKRNSYGRRYLLNSRTFAPEVQVIVATSVPDRHPLVPDTVFDIIGWKIIDVEQYVIDVFLVSHCFDGSSKKVRYRIPMSQFERDRYGYVYESCFGPKQENPEKRLHDLKGMVSKFWTPKILSSPWITEDNSLAFLNEVNLSAPWIIEVCSEVLLEDALT